MVSQRQRNMNINNHLNSHTGREPVRYPGNGQHLLRHTDLWYHGRCPIVLGASNAKMALTFLSHLSLNLINGFTQPSVSQDMKLISHLSPWLMASSGSWVPPRTIVYTWWSLSGHHLHEGYCPAWNGTLGLLLLTLFTILYTYPCFSWTILTTVQYSSVTTSVRPLHMLHTKLSDPHTPV